MEPTSTKSYVQLKSCDLSGECNQIMVHYSLFKLCLHYTSTVNTTCYWIRKSVFKRCSNFCCVSVKTMNDTMATLNVWSNPPYLKIILKFLDHSGHFKETVNHLYSNIWYSLVKNLCTIQWQCLIYKIILHIITTYPNSIAF